MISEANSSIDFRGSGKREIGLGQKSFIESQKMWTSQEGARSQASVSGKPTVLFQFQRRSSALVLITSSSMSHLSLITEIILFLSSEGMARKPLRAVFRNHTWILIFFKAPFSPYLLKIKQPTDICDGI